MFSRRIVLRQQGRPIPDFRRDSPRRIAASPDIPFAATAKSFGWRTHTSRDFPDIGFWAFADSASLRIYGTLVVAAPRKSPIRSSAGVDFTRTETTLSLQPGQTIETRTKLPIAALARMSALHHLHRMNSKTVSIFFCAKPWDGFEKAIERGNILVPNFPANLTNRQLGEF